MEAYQQGDARSFEALLHKHQRPVYNFLCRQIGSPAMAEDLLQEVFMRIIQGAAAYKRQAKFTTWLYTIARNLCVDYARRAKHRKALSLEQPMGRHNAEKSGQSLGERIPDWRPETDRQVIGRQLQHELMHAIEVLPEDLREVFLMREYLDLPFKEIAEIVGCPENTVKSRMRYALERLRQQLAEYQDLAQAMQ